MLKLLGGTLLAALAGCAVDSATATTTDNVAKKDPNHLRNNVKFPNPAGWGATFSTAGSVDLTGSFFTSLGTNGRTCGSCHQPGDGWTVIPSHIQERFEDTHGLDPIFRLNDGANSPNADISTEAKRRTAFSMVLNKGLIRVGLPIPAGADFKLANVDDPYHFASANELSLFRRPLPTANLFFLSTLMWDGRETQVDTHSPALPGSNCLKPPFPNKCFYPIDPVDLLTQANDATLGHAQAMVPGLTDAQRQNIVDFETGVMFAQIKDRHAGRLDSGGALGGAENIPSFPGYFGINDNFGDYKTNAAFTNIIFSLYDAWTASSDNWDQDEDENEDYDTSRAAARRSIARGQALFNNKVITISGVAGLNGSLGLPASFNGTCGTCHDSPEAGNHSVVAPLNIGLTDEVRRTPDMPLYTLECTATGISKGHCTAHQTVKTTDPGRSLLTGVWADIGKFKGPILRGLAARAPFFHNGFAANLGEAVDFYDTRFGIGFTPRERADLVAFLNTL
jgi:cytochrome c peroxidase